MDDGTVLYLLLPADRGDHAASDFEFGLTSSSSAASRSSPRSCRTRTGPRSPSISTAFANISLRDNDQYLCLIGSLDADEGRYLIAYMPFAFIEQNSSLNLGVPAHRRRLCAAHLSRHRVFLLARVHAPARLHGALADHMSRARLSAVHRQGQAGNPTSRTARPVAQRLSAPISSRPSGESSKESNESSLRRRVAEKERIDNMRRDSSSTFRTS